MTHIEMPRRSMGGASLSDGRDTLKSMERRLKIYYTSDVHGRLSPVDHASGRSMPSGLANCIQGFAKDGNTLIIDGGDILQGSPLTYYLYNKSEHAGRLIAGLMNIGGYDFVTLGNHDFNYGRQAIEEYIAALDGRCLCANVSGVAGVEKTAVITMANGLRVGLTGVTTQYVKLWEKPENLNGVAVTDAFSAAAEALRELKAAGTDLNICIYHGGFEKDPTTGETLSATEENQGYRICRELGFDILLAGHQHMPAENLRLFGTYTCQPPDKASRYIVMEVSAGEGVTAVSRLVDAGSEENAAAKRLLAPAEEAAAAWFDTPVGHLDTPLLPSGHIEMAAKGCLIANFFNQVQLEASGADISATSLGNSVKGLGREVTIRDIISTYVFPNTLKTVAVDRGQLKRALERSAEYFALDGRGGLTVSEDFLRPIEQHFNYDYISGIFVTMDIRRPRGDRVVSIKYRGEELPEDKKLTLCLNSYRATGAGGYGVYRECETVRELPTEIAELIISYVDRHREITVDRTKWLNVIY